MQAAVIDQMFLQDKVRTFTIVTRQKKMDNFGGGGDMSTLLGTKNPEVSVQKPFGAQQTK